MVQNSSATDIDPKRLDVATAPRRRRKRDQQEPSPNLKGEKAKALQRALKRPIPPAVMLEPRTGNSGYETASPHNDPDLFDLMIADCFGTRSASVMATFMRQLSYLVGESWDDIADGWKIDEDAFSAALAIVKAAGPRNELEACLAAQAVSVHWMHMRLAKRALKYGGINSQDAAVAGKLAKVFVTQVEAMQALKGKRRTSRQTIKVSKELHQHVHYHDRRGSGENPSQPHERIAPSTDQRATVRGEDASERVVPLSRLARS